MQEQSKPSYIKGAAILAAASVFVKIIGAIYKMPLFQDGVLGDEGTGDFQVTYNVYTLILTIATAGVPAALSRIVAAARAKGDLALARRYFNVAMPGFIIIGLAAMLFMFGCADMLASAMGNSKAATGIRVLAPAVFFVCVISVFRGYAQGHQNMVPTATSQITEVLSKAIFGIALALWFVSLGYESHIVSAGAIVGVTIGLGICIPLLYFQKRKADRKGCGNDGCDVPGMPAGTVAQPGYMQTDYIRPGYIRPAGTQPDAMQPDAMQQSSMTIFARIMKVSIPITLSASFVSLMVVLDSSIVMNRLQYALGMAEETARGLYGIYSRALTIYNLVPSLLIPVSISVLPAIAAAKAAKQSAEAGLIMQSSVKLVNLIAMPAAAGLMVLASPILTALYNDQRDLTATIMTILGCASFFVCLQYITMTILQAHGHERLVLATFGAGASVRLALAWFLAGREDVNILASPIGTLVCFAIISGLNIMFIRVKLKSEAPKFMRVFAGPALCSAVMAVVTFVIHRLLSAYLAGYVSSVRMEAIVFLAIAIAAGIGVYFVLAIITRTITMDDMKLIPKGEKIGRFLRLKQSK